MSTSRYTAYLDESGVASLTDYKSKNFILTCVFVNEEEDKQLSAYFDFIKRKHKIPVDVSLHSNELFSDTRNDLYLSNKKSFLFCNSIAEFVEIAPIEILITSFNKKELRKFLGLVGDSYFKGASDRKRDKDIGYEMLTTGAFMWFSKKLESQSKHNPIGKVISESRKNSDYSILKTYLYCQDPKNFSTKRFIKQSTTFSERVCGITFENKKGLSGGLQIADVISFVANIHLKKEIGKHKERGMKVLWDAIKNKVDKKPDADGIKKIPKSQFGYLLSPARVHKIAEFYRKTSK